MSGPDSITFTTEELDDLIVCVQHAFDEGVGYGHFLPGDAEYEHADDARDALLKKLQRFAAAAKKRAARKTRES